MAVSTGPESVEQVRAQIAEEREQLAAAVDEMRAAADPAKVLGPKLPLLAAGAFAAGFVLGGGIGATMRLVFRRGRESRREEARVGRFALIRRR
jgi:predicted NBD/HSP70 family sugar kinase